MEAVECQLDTLSLQCLRWPPSQANTKAYLERVQRDAPLFAPLFEALLQKVTQEPLNQEEATLLSELLLDMTFAAIMKHKREGMNEDATVKSKAKHLSTTLLQASFEARRFGTEKCGQVFADQFRNCINLAVTLYDT